MVFGDHFRPLISEIFNDRVDARGQDEQLIDRRQRIAVHPCPLHNVMTLHRHLVDARKCPRGNLR